MKYLGFDSNYDICTPGSSDDSLSDRHPSRAISVGYHPNIHGNWSKILLPASLNDASIQGEGQR